MKPVLAITGASGYIGRHVIAHARGRWDVLVLGRRAVPGHGFRPCMLEAPFDPQVLEGVHAVVHLAADTTGAQLAAGVEQRFAVALAAAARERSIPVVVASSQVASPDAPSAYGRTKAVIEAAVLPHGAIVVRPGLVYGGSARGLFGLLEAVCRRLPVLPDLIPRPRVQPVHVDDLADAMLAALERGGLCGRTLAIAGPPISFGAFLAMIARYRLRRRRLRIPTPVALLRGLLLLGARIAGPALSPERLDSLVRIPLMEAAGDLAMLGVSTRGLAEGLSRGIGRRPLLDEGQRLARAFLGHRVGGGLLRRYVRALSALGVTGADPALRGLATVTLRALDVPAARRERGSAAWRAGVLLRLAEADRFCAPTFLVGDRAGAVRLVVDMMRAAVVEVLARALQPWAQWRAGRIA